MTASAYLWLKGMHVAVALLMVAGVVAVGVGQVVLADLPGASHESHRIVSVLRRFDQTLATPALAGVWILGLLAASRGGWMRANRVGVASFPSYWLLVKLVAVVAISAVHGRQSALLRRQAAGLVDKPPLSREHAWRQLLIVLCSVVVIALLAVRKPW